jgi:hypothetical protein
MFTLPMPPQKMCTGLHRSRFLPSKKMKQLHRSVYEKIFFGLIVCLKKVIYDKVQ